MGISSVCGSGALALRLKMEAAWLFNQWLRGFLKGVLAMLVDVARKTKGDSAWPFAFRM